MSSGSGGGGFVCAAIFGCYNTGNALLFAVQDIASFFVWYVTGFGAAIVVVVAAVLIVIGVVTVYATNATETIIFYYHGCSIGW